jgi:molybdopterin converting factor small subunit
MVLQTLSHVGAEKMTEISNLLQVPGNSKRIIAILEELEHLRIFSNEALKKRGKQMGIVVPQIKENDWHWSMTRRTAVIQRTVDDGSTTISDDDEVEVLPNTNAPAATV